MSDYRDQNHEQNQGRENGSGQSGWTYYNGSQRPREERGANQYSSSNGWQEQQPQDQRPGQESYRWNYDDYDIPKNGGKRKNSGLVVFISIIAIVLVLGLVTVAGLGIYQLMGGAQQTQSGTESSEAMISGSSDYPSLSLNDKPEEDSAPSADGTLSTVEIVRQVRPSVVGVVVYDTSISRFSPTSEGSGIIISTDGYIVTNAHVVSGADAIKVVLDNDEEYEAQLVGLDTITDLAVLKIDADNLVAATFGNSDQIEVGETAIAIGNPGGLFNSVTQGIISAASRPVTTSDGTTTVYIQHDAAISPGNSGGALLNAYGQVIGINSAKIAADNYEGIAFAIPINEAEPIINQLIEYGYVRGRVRLGITVSEIDELVARLNDLPTGLYIEDIAQDSDLLNHGVQRFDIITAVEGEPVSSFADLSAILEDYSPGDEITLTIYRRGYYSQNDQTFDVTVELLEDTSGAVGTIQASPQSSSR